MSLQSATFTASDARRFRLPPARKIFETSRNLTTLSNGQQTISVERVSQTAARATTETSA